MSAFEIIDDKKTKYTLIPFNKVDGVSLYKSMNGGYELHILIQGGNFISKEDNAKSLYESYRGWLGR